MKKLLVDLVRVPYNLVKSGFYRVISFKAFREMSPKILETVICGAKKVFNQLPRLTLTG
jgi:hypothetical protein